MQHEVAVALVSVDVVEQLLVLNSSERGDCQRLGLTSGEQCASVRPCQNSDLAGDVPDFGDFPSVDSFAVVEDAGPEDLICEIIKELGDLLSAIVLDDDIGELDSGLFLCSLEGGMS